MLYRFDRLPLEGVVIPASYLATDHLELITTAGTLHTASYEDAKALCFASEPGPDDLFREHNLFERRPKVPGLWTRFTFRDGDRLDGILSRNLLDWPKAGFLITPPRAGVARQRVFIPRAALTGTELLGVVGTSALAVTQGRKKSLPEDAGQLRMFDR